MTSALPNFMDTLRSNWEAATPYNDGSGALYSCIDTLAGANTSGLHREFRFRPWGACDLIEERADSVQLCEYEIVVDLFVHRNHREDDAFNRQSAHEVAALRHRWSGVNDWGVGVQDAFLGKIINTPSAATNNPPRAGGINRSEVFKLAFPFRVKVEENG